MSRNRYVRRNSWTSDGKQVDGLPSPPFFQENLPSRRNSTTVNKLDHATRLIFGYGLPRMMTSSVRSWELPGPERRTIRLFRMDRRCSKPFLRATSTFLLLI